MSTIGEKQETVRRALLASGYTAAQVSEGLTEAAFAGHYHLPTDQLEAEVRKALGRPGAIGAGSKASPAAQEYVASRSTQAEAMRKAGVR